MYSRDNTPDLQKPKDNSIADFVSNHQLQHQRNLLQLSYTRNEKLNVVTLK